MPPAARIKRFDEVDTDSDFDFEEEAAARHTLPTMSFKTATEDSDSIAFESDREHSEHHAPPAARLSKVPPHPTSVSPPPAPSSAPPTPPAAAPAKEAAPPAATSLALAIEKRRIAPTAQPAAPPSAAVSMPEKKKKKSLVDTVAETAAIPPPAGAVQSTPLIPRQAPAAPLAPVTKPPISAAASHPTPAAAAAFHIPTGFSPSSTGQVHSHDPESSDNESDEFMQQVLPVRPRPSSTATAAAPTTTAVSPSQLWTSTSTDRVDTSGVLPRAPPPPADSAADEVLVRAQLRLEERRRLGTSAAVSGSRQRSPWRGATSPASALRDSAVRQSASVVNPAPGSDQRLRRLQQENSRLQDEVAFLGRENQKLRGVQNSADASEAVRLQLTVDMLRKDIESKQVAFQRSLESAYGEAKVAQGQVGEAAEQCESYRSSAEQYRQLYEEKQKEVEKVKTQLQSLLYDVNTMEQHHRQMESDYAEKVSHEREKTEQALAVASDIKGQRDHLQFLNAQLRGEVTSAVESRRQSADQMASLNDVARRDRADQERRIEQLNEDVAQLRKVVAEKERVIAAQAREWQQTEAMLQGRLKELAEDQQREAERSRRTQESVKEEMRKASQQEKARRAELEEQLRLVEESARSQHSRHTSTVALEAETRVRKFKDDAQAERVAREGTEREALRLATESEELRESADYFQQECQRMTANFSQSEQLRDKAERQCISLAQTLEDIMAQDDDRARQIQHLEESLSAAQWGASAGAGRIRDADGVYGDLQQLSDENDRLTGECTRLADERDHLIEENGKIAEELLRWKQEMRQYVASHVKSATTPRKRASRTP